MKLESLKNKKILIVGRGIEGTDAYQFLRQEFPRQTIAIANTSEETFLHQRDFDIAIKSPGIPRELLKISFTTPTNIFFSEVKGTTIGVTGTKGKSTTASLIQHILKTAGFPSYLVGNIGSPMLGSLRNSNKQSDYFVIELSSFQLSDIDSSPHISVVLNLFDEHLDYHHSSAEYRKAKLHIVDYTTPQDYFIYNDAFAEIVKKTQTIKAKCIPIIKTLPFSTAGISLLGNHNVENIKAATTATKLLAIPNHTIITAIKSFQPLPHRLENLGTYQGITFYDDALATTPEATIAALSALPKVGTLFLGGQDRGYDFSQLAIEVIRHKIPNLVLFPDSGEKILVALKKITNELPEVLQTRSMEEAVQFAYTKTRQGMICLLSCASPSFSVWKNYKEKAQKFKDAVLKFASM